VLIGAVFMVVFGFFSYLRFNNLPQRTIFNWDQERDALVIRKMFDLKKPVLIGPRVLGPNGFFLPPVYYYVLAPFYLVGGFSPLSVVWFIVVYNLVFFVLAGYLLSRMFSWQVGLIFLSFWAVIGHFISIDTISWNPLAIPLMSLLFVYLFKLKQEKTNLAVSFLFGLVFGLGVGLHVQFLGLIPLLVSGLVSKKTTLKHNLLSLAGVVFPFASLLVFDLRHQFINAKLFLGLISESSQGSPIAFLPVWQNVVNSLLKINSSGFVGPIFYLIVFALIIILVKKSINKLFYKSILAVWVLFPLAFAFYGQRPSEYYFNYLLPIIILVVSVFIDKLLASLKKPLARLVVVLLASFFLVSAVGVAGVSPGKDSLYHKDQLVHFLSKETKDKTPFNLSFDLGSGGDAGYHYLVDYYQVGYSEDENSPLIELVLPAKREASFMFGASGLLFPSGWLKDNWL
jgi:4-amino-4-deoxy-L-arabinose transferase-like glycosyltransferase